MGKNSKFIKGGIIGAIIGAIAGILFAPKSGKETRQDIKDAATKAKASAEERLKVVYQELGDKLDESKEYAKELSGRAKKEAEDLRKRAEIAQAKLKEMIAAVKAGEVTQRDVDEAIESAEKAARKLKTKSKK